MSLGDMMGKAMGALGGGEGFDLTEKMGEMGLDASMLEGLDIESAKAMLAEKGLDLSALEEMGLNVEDILAKFTGGGE